MTTEMKKQKTVTEFTWELIGGVTLGFEIMENPEFNGKEEDLIGCFVAHLGIIRLVFSTYALEG